LSRNALIILIQSYAGCYSGLLTTIRFGLAASLSSSAGLTEGLYNLSMMTSGSCPDVGHTVLQTC
jgi:hypothetical protein